MDIVQNAAARCNQHFVNHRWLGGMLTNWSTISSSINKLNNYKKILKYDFNYTKKELLSFTKEKKRLQKFIGGIQFLNTIPNLIFVIDVKSHSIAIKEANRLGIPIIGIVDTNSNPDGIDFVIPGNDDSRKAINLYCNLVTETILKASSKNIC